MENRMVWLAVRCCCTPTKLFGFMPVSEREAQGREIVVDGHRLQIQRISECTIHDREALMRDGPMPEPTFNTERAIYSEDRSLSFWRAMPGFVEAFDHRSRP
jgi:hypothetical protein